MDQFPVIKDEQRKPSDDQQGEFGVSNTPSRDLAGRTSRYTLRRGILNLCVIFLSVLLVVNTGSGLFVGSAIMGVKKGEYRCNGI